MIALAPNIARRQTFAFWRRWVAMLAGTLPAWIVPLLIAIAFPVMRPGNLILFKDGLMVFGDCSCCTAAYGSACVHCTATPLTWSVTFTDVENGSPCHHGGGLRGARQAGTGTLGTYTVTQTATACVWSAQTNGPSLDFYDDIFPPCVTFDQSHDDLNVTLEKDSDTDIRIQALQGISPTFNGGWFDGNVTTANLACCTTTGNANNIYAAYTADHVGINGHAVATPSC